MARARLLKPDFFDDEKMADLPFGARLLFEAMWTQADREGLLEDRPLFLASYTFPYDKPIQKKGRKETPEYLDALAKAECILRYEVDGQRLIWLPHFRDHQKIHEREAQSSLPPYPSEKPRQEPATPRHAIANLRDEKSAGIESEAESEAEAEYDSVGESETRALGATEGEPTKRIKQAFENRIGTIPFSILGEFEEYARFTAEEWFIAAIEVTREDADHPSWAYCKKVIDNAVRQNRPPEARSQAKVVSMTAGDVLARRQQRRAR